jgi:hypothetical protein
LASPLQRFVACGKAAQGPLSQNGIWSSMADTKHAPHMGYGPEMDAATHESTYTSFVHFAAVGVAFVLCCVVGLAVGGIKQAWMSAIFGIVLAHIATAIGLFAPSISWRAPGAVLVLLLLMLAFF